MADLLPSNQTMPSRQLSAGSNTTGRASDVLLHLVTFDLLGEEFGVPILDVREVILMPQITPVPQAPAFVEGVINLRGQIIPIVDLRKRFGLDTREADSQTRIVVVEVNDSVLGLIVDGDSEVMRIPADLVKPAPSLISSGIGAEYIKGIAHHDGKMIILIDLYKVFSADEMKALENAL